MNDERAAKPIDRKLGQRVRTRRLEIGMSQERLAELLGVTFQQVQKYEKGVNRIAASRLHDIASALELPVARFYEGIAAGRGPGVAESTKDYIDDALATPEGAQLMALFAAIKSQKVRRRVVELVKALTEEGAEGKRGS
ncbi:helix-turn-helix domain-containing protein [Terricaulis silvestris]|uniref:Transcriptional repressor DicA n=1 Tax=Terricaulis silvestris TaxID=2686094 RepID=A0A6I6MZ81_9CAUL|nr:helix-turn-helix transcriptional regulator [Terricaulis silvestris]QGZ96952.1 transcriptional repressor DicA [Terricaulis silvestris]